MSSPIQETFPLGLHWPTAEPFLFCAHHVDRYPRGNESLGVDPSAFRGRNMGSDFEPKDGFRMYHGEPIPGFPVHPHRGFETVTLVLRGYVDHADSMGAAGRYGEGDVQWMTAGDGVQHSEMFPLLHRDKENTAELFQIWLNLPRKHKRVPPHFKMFWSEKIPRIVLDAQGSEVSVIAGEFQAQKGLTPPPHSWASEPGSDVQILLVRLAAGGVFELPAAPQGSQRVLYFYEGGAASLGKAGASEALKPRQGYALNPNASLRVEGSAGFSKLLVLQARPIGEPVAQHGPFVMNTRDEIVQAFRDFERTQFGGWPWDREDVVHGPEIRRFARYPDGREETPAGTEDA